MTNKKLWLSLLAVVLIVCMLSVGLMSCKKKTDEPVEDPDEPEVTLEEQAAEAIVEGIRNSLASADMTDLTVDGKIGLKIGDEQYDLKLALDLDLLQHNGYNYNKCTASSTFDTKTTYYTKVEDADEYEEAKDLTQAEFDANKTNYYTRGTKKGKETSTKSNTFLNAELVKDDEVLLGIYYWDSNESVAAANAYDQNVVYIQYFDKESDTTKKMTFPAPYVNATMKAMDAYVDFHGIKLDELDFWDTLGGILPVIGSLADKTQTEFVANEKASLTINLGAVLTQFSDVLSNAGGFVEPLGLDLDLSKLGEILPAISIKLAAKFDSTGKANGVELSLVVPKKNIEIKNKNTEEAFLKIGMDKDVNVGLSLDYKVGVTPTPLLVDFDDFVDQKNIIDVEVGLDLFLSETIAMNLTDTMSISVNAGYYTAHATLALNPFCVLKDVKSLSFDGIANIIETINKLLPAISSLELTLQRTHDATHAPVEEAPAIRLIIADNYRLNGQLNGKMAAINTTLLSGADLNLGIVDIDEAINTVSGVVKGLIDPEDESPTSTPSTEGENAVPPILTTIGQYLQGAYIGINDGDHSDIYVAFDTNKIAGKLIPFSGYTEYKGDLAELGNFKLYQKTSNGGYEVNNKAFDSTKTYYTKIGGNFRKVNKETEAYNENRKYYTVDSSSTTGYSKGGKITQEQYNSATEYYVYVKEAYELANITKFETGVTYYTYNDPTYAEITKANAIAAVTAWNALTAEEKADTENHPKPVYYVLGLNEKGGDYGVGITNTSLAIEFDEGTVSIDLNATVTNLGFIGLPNSLTARINNLTIKLWQNNYPVFQNDEIIKYSELQKA